MTTLAVLFCSYQQTKPAETHIRNGSSNNSGSKKGNPSNGNSTDSTKHSRSKKSKHSKKENKPEKLRMQVMDEDTVKVSVYGDIYRCHMSGMFHLSKGQLF